MQLRVGAARLAEPQGLLAEDVFALRFFRWLFGVRGRGARATGWLRLRAAVRLFLQERCQVETRRCHLGFDMSLVIPRHRSPSGKFGCTQTRLDVLQFELVAAFDVIAAHGEGDVRQPLAQSHQVLGAELESDVGVPVASQADRAVGLHLRPGQLGAKPVELDFFLRGRNSAAGRQAFGRHVASHRRPSRSGPRQQLRLRTSDPSREGRESGVFRSLSP